MKNTRITQAIGIALFTLALANPAHAIFRAYLSSSGSDANPCTLTLPCRLLPAALAAADPFGEVWMLDSANYNTGPVTITKSVSILAIPGEVGSIVLTGGPSNDGLVIATSGLRVSLRNIVMVMLGSGRYGIYVSAPNGSLVIQQSEFANIGGMGGAMYIDAASKVLIQDTVVRDSNSGLYFNNGVAANLDRVRIENTGTGIASNNSKLAVSNGVFAGNSTGIFISVNGGNVSSAEIDSTQFSHNGTGLLAGSFVSGDLALASVSRSTFSHNMTEAIRASANNNGQAEVILDANVFTFNQAAVTGTGTPGIVSRGNNTVKRNTGGDVLPGVTPLSGQ